MCIRDSDRLTSGLKQHTITKVSDWAEEYRVMGQPFPGPWRFTHHPWSREMHDCTAELMVGMKAAQMAYTETALNKAFKAIDLDGISVLYVLPASTPDASDFSTSRFDPALEMSPHLRNLFSDVKNIGHKRAGNANFYIRGSRSRSQLKSIPTGLNILDEVDEYVQENIALTFERMSGQLVKQTFLFSTPTIPMYGVHKYFKDSTQRHFFFKCPHCGRQTELIFPDCLVITAEDVTDVGIRGTYLKCKECSRRLEHDDKINFLKTGKWVPTYTNRLSEGYHVNQLYSMTVKPYELAISYLNGQSNPADEQEFYNSKLGIPHEPEGAKITDSMLEECIGSYKMLTTAPPGAFVTMGVDIGKWLHYEICQWSLIEGHSPSIDINLLATPRVLAAGKVLNFNELDNIMYQYRVAYCVVDSSPEHRMALEFANRFYGHVKLCIYGEGVRGKQLNIHSEEEHTITVDRTSWLDLSLGRFRTKKIALPQDTTLEYKNHIKAPVRIYTKDKSGNPVAKYVTGNEQDHFAHARNYAEIALPLAVADGVNQDIRGVY